MTSPLHLGSLLFIKLPSGKTQPLRLSALFRTRGRNDKTYGLLSTPGHTPGHQSLYVKLTNTGGVVVPATAPFHNDEETSGTLVRALMSGQASTRRVTMWSVMPG